jgi:hypothetical protein
MKPPDSKAVLVTPIGSGVGVAGGVGGTGVSIGTRVATSVGVFDGLNVAVSIVAAVGVGSRVSIIGVEVSPFRASCDVAIDSGDSLVAESHADTLTTRRISNKFDDRLRRSIMPVILNHHNICGHVTTMTLSTTIRS